MNISSENYPTHELNRVFFAISSLGDPLLLAALAWMMMGLVLSSVGCTDMSV